MFLSAIVVTTKVAGCLGNPQLENKYTQYWKLKVTKSRHMAPGKEHVFQKVYQKTSRIKTED